MFPYRCSGFVMLARLRHRQLAAVGQVVQVTLALRQAATVPGHLLPGAPARPRALEVLAVRGNGAEGGGTGCQRQDGLRRADRFPGGGVHGASGLDRSPDLR